MSEHPYTVGRTDGTGPIVGFPTLGEAERYIANYVAAHNPAGVERGDYYIDGPAEHEQRCPHCGGVVRRGRDVGGLCPLCGADTMPEGPVGLDAPAECEHGYTEGCPDCDNSSPVAHFGGA